MVEPAAFDLYDIGDPKSKVMFGLRDFKNAIMLADTLKYSMYLSFHRGGQPISIEIRVQDHGMQQPVAMAQFTIATSEPDEASNEEIAQHQVRRQEALNEQRRKDRGAEAVQAQRQQQANGHAQQERDERSSASMVAEGLEAVGRHNGPVQSTLMAEKDARNEIGATTAQGTSERAKPLFREDATSSSQGSVPPSQQPSARRDEEAHDTFDDEFADNDADLQQMQELEESIQRGEIVPRGSQGSQLVPPPVHSQKEKTAELAAGEYVDPRREAASTEPTSASDSLSQQRRTIQRVGFASPIQEDSESRIEPGDNIDGDGEKANEEREEENGEEEAESDFGELQDYSESARIAKRRREMMLANDSLFQNESMGTSEGGEEDGGEDLNEEELGATDDEGGVEGEADEDEDLLSAGERRMGEEKKRNTSGGSAGRTNVSFRFHERSPSALTLTHLATFYLRQSYQPLFPE